MLRAKDTFRKMYSAAKGYYCGGLASPNAFSALDLRHPLSSSRKPPGHANLFRVRSYTQCALTNDSADQEVVIALGSNVGDRVSMFDRALRLMRSSGIKVTRHACLYETAPAYVTDQPRFLNSAVRGTTKLGPHELLRKLKEIEKDIGRTAGVRYGPRPIDLDILLYGDSRIKTESLIVPHERIHERPFVLAPLVDLLGSSAEDGMEKSWHSGTLSRSAVAGSLICGTSSAVNLLLEQKALKGSCLLEIRCWTGVRGPLLWGCLTSRQTASATESTRPFARRLSAEEELERLVPVLDAIMKLPEMEGKLLSVDTFYAQVAAETVKRGATMINDVSGGQLDPSILQVVAELEVLYVTMHMRGDPSTMQNEQNLQYDDVCKEVASELYARLRAAELSGIPLWRVILDPGIGFSKKSTQNIEVIAGLESIREEMGKMSLGASHVPILLGPSRKSFLGEICSRADPVERDAATASTVTIAILNGANIVRVHNVRYNVDAAKVSDALLKYRRK